MPMRSNLHDIVDTGNVGASGSSPALRTPCPQCVCVQIMVCIPGRDDLTCSRGLNAVIPTEICTARVVSVRNPHMDGVVMIPAETIFWGFCYRGYRYAKPTAKHGLSLIGIDCISAMRVLRATFQSPLQLRDGALR